eukprot:CAMPEP_0184485278 /NCGR_PEP_ID=MMETSP0113_2-20130426/6909_1 /TAXON_ID=91329 /ORGANISM="Norrisiella sphaerica, Strain BC52" /LENGTH=178 /DNA_ID=CAMNT_0026866667 /DNA_START=184 /DNA_END=720 /DNA_ORIENTATION=+
MTVAPRIAGMHAMRMSGHLPRHRNSPHVTLAPPVEDRVDTEKSPAAARKDDIPAGYRWYETMLVIQPRLSEMEKDIQLGYFEKILGKGKAINVMKLDRGKHPLSYPMNKHFEAYYVLYSFASPPNVPIMIQDWNNNPGVDSEGQFLRVINTRLPEDAIPPSAQVKDEDGSNSDSLWDL